MTIFSNVSIKQLFSKNLAPSQNYFLNQMMVSLFLFLRIHLMRCSLEVPLRFIDEVEFRKLS